VLVYSADPELAGSVARQLGQRGIRCTRVGPSAGLTRAGDYDYYLDATDPAQCAELIAGLDADGRRPTALVHLVAAKAPAGPPAEDFEAELGRGMRPFLALAGALLTRRRGEDVRVLFAHPGEAGVAPAAYAAMTGLLKTLALEHSGLAGTCLSYGEGIAADTAATRIAAELAGIAPASSGAAVDELGEPGEPVTQAGYRGDTRYARRLLPTAPAAADEQVPLPLRPGGTYLITGGTGALGLHTAEFLARHGQAITLVLAARGEPGDEARRRMDAVAAAGTTVHWTRTDLTDPAQVDALVADTRSRFGDLHGIVHAAGVTRDGLSAGKD